MPEYQLPQFQAAPINTNFTFKPDPLLNPSVTSSPNEVFKLLASMPQGQMTAVLPYIQNVLGNQSQFLQPAVSGIREQGEIGAASAQSDILKRNLTGSDMELAAMAAPRLEAGRNIASLYGQAGLQQASQMAEYIMKAMGMDVESNQNLYMALAQALGQQMSNEASALSFDRQMQAAGKATQWARDMAGIQFGTDVFFKLLGGLKKEKQGGMT